MSPRARLAAHALLVLLGILLMIGGIITEKHGATGIGLIVAGVNAWQFLKVRNT